MAGQDALNAARAFGAALDLTGIVLTKADGDARGGVALSVREVTGKPIVFLGMGEKTDALEPFDPERMASRILGMGDVVSLVEQVQREVNTDEATRLAQKVARGKGFDLVDLKGQLEQVQKLGGMGSLLDKLPAAAGRRAVSADQGDREVRRQIAIINSMTQRERRQPGLIDGSRRRRIAGGAGVQVQDVNRLLKQFLDMQRMMKSLKGGNLRRLMGSFKGTKIREYHRRTKHALTGHTGPERPRLAKPARPLPHLRGRPQAFRGLGADGLDSSHCSAVRSVPWAASMTGENLGILFFETPPGPGGLEDLRWGVGRCGAIPPAAICTPIESYLPLPSSSRASRGSTTTRPGSTLERRAEPGPGWDAVFPPGGVLVGSLRLAPACALRCNKLCIIPEGQWTLKSGASS